VTVGRRLKLELSRYCIERGVRQYEVARHAAMHPSTLSAIVNEAVPVRTNDPRVQRIAAVLGVQKALSD